MFSQRDADARRSPSTWPLRFVGGLLLITSAATAVGQSSFESRARALRAEHDRKRREFDAEFKRTQREFERSWNEQKSDRTTSSLSRPQTPAKRPALSYRFPAGRRFAYSVRIEWEHDGKSIRLVGRPYYQILHEVGSKSTALVVGRFRRFLPTADDEEFRHDPARDYWMGTCVVLDDDGIEATPRDGRGGLDLPYLMTKMVSLPTLIMPNLPPGIGATEGRSEPAVLTTSRKGPLIWSGFVSKIGLTGRSFHYIRSSSLSSHAVRLDIECGFERENDPMSAVYAAQGTFDLSEGLLRELQATYRLKRHGGSVQASVSVRLLAGDEFAQAADAAMHDIEALPKDHMPQELARTPIDLFLPQAYGVDDLPEPGTIVGHYDKSMRQYFLVMFVKRTTPTLSRIRFEGSGETRLVHPASITRLTSRKR